MSIEGFFLKKEELIIEVKRILFCLEPEGVWRYTLEGEIRAQDYMRTFTK